MIEIQIILMNISIIALCVIVIYIRRHVNKLEIKLIRLSMRTPISEKTLNELGFKPLSIEEIKDNLRKVTRTIS